MRLHVHHIGRNMAATKEGSGLSHGDKAYLLADPSDHYGIGGSSLDASVLA